MKQATENILRNDSIYELEETCPRDEAGEPETVSCKQKWHPSGT